MKKMKNENEKDPQASLSLSRIFASLVTYCRAMATGPPEPEVQPETFETFEGILGSVAGVARDVVFSFAEEGGGVVGEVDGHQKVFAAVSPAFETLFEEHRVESGEGDVLSIVMKASARKAFAAMTAHIYQRQTAAAEGAELDLPDVMELACLAQRFQVDLSLENRRIDASIEKFLNRRSC